MGNKVTTPFVSRSLETLKIFESGLLLEYFLNEQKTPRAPPLQMAWIMKLLLIFLPPHPSEGKAVRHA